MPTVKIRFHEIVLTEKDIEVSQEKLDEIEGMGYMKEQRSENKKIDFLLSIGPEMRASFIAHYIPLFKKKSS